MRKVQGLMLIKMMRWALKKESSILLNQVSKGVSIMENVILPKKVTQKVPMVVIYMSKRDPRKVLQMAPEETRMVPKTVKEVVLKKVMRNIPMVVIYTTKRNPRKVLQMATEALRKESRILLNQETRRVPETVKEVVLKKVMRNIPMVVIYTTKRDPRKVLQMATEALKKESKILLNLETRKVSKTVKEVVLKKVTKTIPMVVIYMSKRVSRKVPRMATEMVTEVMSNMETRKVLQTVQRSSSYFEVKAKEGFSTASMSRMAATISGRQLARRNMLGSDRVVEKRKNCKELEGVNLDKSIGEGRNVGKAKAEFADADVRGSDDMDTDDEKVDENSTGKGEPDTGENADLFGESGAAFEEDDIEEDVDITGPDKDKPNPLRFPAGYTLFPLY
ncbi:hypothetical protein KM043_014414 [Ampulex compressa]|nr:hypothetical protein KM043_014414 [Ampulex compressa]